MPGSRALVPLVALALLAGPSPAATAEPPAPITITLERTMCFGTCPVYTLTLGGDGTVRYEGRQFVRVTGVHTWKIRPAAVRDLAREFERAGYFSLQDEYTARITDLPTTITSVTIGERKKTVKDYYGAPDELRRLERRIDEVAGSRKWTVMDPKSRKPSRDPDPA